MFGTSVRSYVGVCVLSVIKTELERAYGCAWFAKDCSYVMIFYFPLCFWITLLALCKVARVWDVESLKQFADTNEKKNLPFPTLK